MSLSASLSEGPGSRPFGKVGVHVGWSWGSAVTLWAGCDCQLCPLCPADFRRRFLALLSYQFSTFSPAVALNIIQNRSVGKPAQPGEWNGASWERHLSQEEHVPGAEGLVLILKLSTAPGPQLCPIRHCLLPYTQAAVCVTAGLWV